MEVTKLAARARPSEFYQYEVQGSGMLPLDMLWFDSTWPADSQAVALMLTARLRARTGSQDEERRTIRLASYSRPTVSRWRSFGWLVVGEEAKP